MTTITVEGFSSFEATPNQRLVLALENNGVDVLHRCGGVARCTTCLVEVIAGEAGPYTEAEYDVLTNKGLLGQGRLSCQLTCANDLTVKPVRTVSSSGLEAGRTPADHIEPIAVYRED